MSLESRQEEILSYSLTLCVGYYHICVDSYFRVPSCLLSSSYSPIFPIYCCFISSRLLCFFNSFLSLSPAVFALTLIPSSTSALLPYTHCFCLLLRLFSNLLAIFFPSTISPHLLPSYPSSLPSSLPPSSTLTSSFPLTVLLSLPRPPFFPLQFHLFLLSRSLPLPPSPTSLRPLTETKREMTMLR